MKTRNIVIVIVLILIGGLFYLKGGFNNPCLPPVRPVTVPKDAIWSGDCDGGNWIELVEIKNNRYRFRIYQDYNGVLLMDANFKSNCNKCSIDMYNWKNLVCCYSLSNSDSTYRLELKKNEGTGEDCYLESVYPAYAGEDWTLIQEISQKENQQQK